MEDSPFRDVTIRAPARHPSNRGSFSRPICTTHVLSHLSSADFIG